MTVMPVKTVSAIVTYLEMHRAPVKVLPPPANMSLALLQVNNIPVHFYRYLYETTGRRYNWVERSDMDDGQLLGEIHKPGVEIWVLLRGGAPAGFFELDFSRADVVRLAYFGLLEGMTGQGLGKYLLGEALTRAWRANPRKVTVNTNTLDHPAALPLYQRYGFVPAGRKTIELRQRDD